MTPFLQFACWLIWHGAIVVAVCVVMALIVKALERPA